MSETPEREEPDCSTCRFWLCDDDNDTEGKCRRSPPVIVLALLEEKMTVNLTELDAAQSAFSWEQPWTYHDDWCGEHQPK